MEVNNSFEKESVKNESLSPVVKYHMMSVEEQRMNKVAAKLYLRARSGIFQKMVMRGLMGIAEESVIRRGDSWLLLDHKSKGNNDEICGSPECAYARMIARCG